MTSDQTVHKLLMNEKTKRKKTKFKFKIDTSIILGNQ